MNARPTTDGRTCPSCRRLNPEDRMTCWRCGNWMDVVCLDDEDEQADYAAGSWSDDRCGDSEGRLLTTE